MTSMDKTQMKIITEQMLTPWQNLQQKFENRLTNRKVLTKSNFEYGFLVK